VPYYGYVIGFSLPTAPGRKGRLDVQKRNGDERSVNMKSILVDRGHDYEVILKIFKDLPSPMTNPTFPCIEIPLH